MPLQSREMMGWSQLLASDSPLSPNRTPFRLSHGCRHRLTVPPSPNQVRVVKTTQSFESTSQPPIHTDVAQRGGQS